MPPAAVASDRLRAGLAVAVPEYPALDLVEVDGFGMVGWHRTGPEIVRRAVEPAIVVPVEGVGDRGGGDGRG